MAHSEARAWWADVEHLRDDYARTDEARRRADEADLASRKAVRERRGVEAELSRVRAPMPGAHPAAGGVSPRMPDLALAPRRGEHADADADDLPFAAVARHGARVRGSGAPGRRTIEIRGRTVPAPVVPRVAELERRPRRAVERVAARPDRVAMWALLMGLMLILVALGTAGSPT